MKQKSYSTQWETWRACVEVAVIVLKTFKKTDSLKICQLPKASKIQNFCFHLYFDQFVPNLNTNLANFNQFYL